MPVSTIVFNKHGLSSKTIENVQKISETFIILSTTELDKQIFHKRCKNIHEILSECNKFANNTDNNILIISGEGFECSILAEMMAVLDICERHAAVSPRGINMGALSVPAFSCDISDKSLDEHKKAHRLIVDHMPRYHIVPYPSPICVLLRGSLIKKFGFLDISYTNFDDAVIAWCLARGQVGYSNIAANKQLMCNTDTNCNNYIADKQFKYIEKLTENYQRYGLSIFDRFAGVISDTYNDKPKILLCMYQLAPVYNGTAEHAFSLAKRLVKQYSDKYEFHLMISLDNAVFFKVHNDFPTVVYPEKVQDTYHIGITFSQIYQTELLVLLNTHCLKIISTVLDLISYRCMKFAVNTDMLAFRKSVQCSDGIITISETVKHDLAAAFPMSSDDILRKTRSIFISNADKQTLKYSRTKSLQFDDFILVFGNSYAHKLINLIFPYLLKIKRNFIIVGYTEKSKNQNIQSFPSGSLSYEFVEQLYKNCTALLFPSEYEGYGLPVINALEKGKTVIVNNTCINRELQASYPQYKDKFLFFNTFDEIKILLETHDLSTDLSPAPVGRTYDDVVIETEIFISDILKEHVNFEKLLARNELSAMMTRADMGMAEFFKFYIRKKYPSVFSTLKRIKKMLCP